MEHSKSDLAPGTVEWRLTTSQGVTLTSLLTGRRKDNLLSSNTWVCRRRKKKHSPRFLAVFSSSWRHVHSVFSNLLWGNAGTRQVVTGVCSSGMLPQSTSQGTVVRSWSCCLCSSCCRYFYSGFSLKQTQKRKLKWCEKKSNYKTKV